MLLPPAYVVRREGNVFTGVCLLTFGGGTRSQIWGGGPGLRFGGGYPVSGLGGGTWSQVWGGTWSQVWGGGSLCKGKIWPDLA